MRIIAAHLVPHWQTEMTDEQKSPRLDMSMVQDHRSKEKKKKPRESGIRSGRACEIGASRARCYFATCTAYLLKQRQLTGLPAYLP